MCGYRYQKPRRSRRRSWTEDDDWQEEAASKGLKPEALPPEPLSKRSWMWVLSRPSVFGPFMLAGFFLLERGPFFLVMMFAGFGVVRIMNFLSTPGVEERVRLRAEKNALGLNKHRLSEAERQEVLAVDDYRKRLVRAGGDPALADQVMAGAWEVVRQRTGGPGSARRALIRYRQDLPAIDVELDAEAEAGEPSLKEKLENELHILRATHRELNV